MIIFLIGLGVGGLAAGFSSFLVWRGRQRKISRLLAFAGHEMNTPVTALRLTTLNFLEGIFGDLEAEQKSWLEIMNEQTGRLAFLVGELRDFVHLELGDDIALRLQPSSVAEIVSEGQLSIRRGLEQSGIKIESSVPENIPQVLVDPDRVIRVLSSLLFYARKFHREGPLSLRVVCGDQWVDVVCRFAVHPMTQEDLEQSLDVYYPAVLADSPKLQSAGFGLGFARQLMRAQGADMISKLGEDGSLSFVLRLPLVEVNHGR